MAGKKTTDALNRVAAFLSTDTDELAVGDGTTAATQTDTALENEVHRGTPTTSTPALGESRQTLRLTVADANGFTLTEAGNFRAVTAMQDRIVHAPVPKNNTFELVYQVTTRGRNA
jgi:hypothetical protein